MGKKIDRINNLEDILAEYIDMHSVDGFKNAKCYDYVGCPYRHLDDPCKERFGLIDEKNLTMDWKMQKTCNNCVALKYEDIRENEYEINTIKHKFNRFDFESVFSEELDWEEVDLDEYR